MEGVSFLYSGPVSCPARTRRRAVFILFGQGHRSNRSAWVVDLRLGGVAGREADDWRHPLKSIASASRSENHELETPTHRLGRGATACPVGRRSAMNASPGAGLGCRAGMHSSDKRSGTHMGWWPRHSVEPIIGVMVSDMYQKAPKVDQGIGQPRPLRPETSGRSAWPSRWRSFACGPRTPFLCRDSCGIPEAGAPFTVYALASIDRVRANLMSPPAPGRVR